jgi:hypothetical protein
VDVCAHLMREPRPCSPPSRRVRIRQEPIVFDLATALLAAPVVVPMDINIDPNSDGLPGIAQLRTIVGAVMTVGLILSVLALIISAIVWGFGANSSNPHLAGRGKIGVLVSCGAAVICGASVTLINFFWNVGQQV